MHYFALFSLAIQSSKGTSEFARVCPFPVNEYSTRGGISLYAFLIISPRLSSSLSRAARVLVLIEFKILFSSRKRSFWSVQQNMKSISRVPLPLNSFIMSLPSVISLIVGL